MKKETKQRLWLCCFIGYGLLMLYLMLIRGRSTSSPLPYWENVVRHLNWRPLETISNFWDILLRRAYYLEKFGSSYGLQARHAIVNLAGNVIMFLPLGIFLPQCIRHLQALWKTLLAAGAMILLLECLQLFTLRGTWDIDDLLLNLLGTLAGYGLWKLIKP